MTPTTAAKPALDLGSLDPVRAFVRIDGSDYRYRADMDLDLVHLAKIERIRQRLNGLNEEAEPGPERSQILADAITEGVGLIMLDPIPGEVLGKLNDVQRLAILDAFTRATLRVLSPKLSKARKALLGRRSTSPRSSRASSASTGRRTPRSG